MKSQRCKENDVTKEKNEIKEKVAKTIVKAWLFQLMRIHQSKIEISKIHLKKLSK